MFWYFIGIFALGSLLTLVVTLSSKNGSKAAQLEALKAELRKRAEEEARANKIIDSVRNMPSDDVRKRLQNISGK